MPKSEFHFLLKDCQIDSSYFNWYNTALLCNLIVDSKNGKMNNSSACIFRKE